MDKVGENARRAAVISSPDPGVTAVIAGARGLRRGHVICGGVSAVAGVTAAAVSRGGPSFGLLDGLGGEGFEFADQFAEAPGVVEQGTVSLELGLAERPGDGPGADFADP